MPAFTLIPPSRSNPAISDAASSPSTRRRFTFSSMTRPTGPEVFLQELIGHHRLPLPAQVDASSCASDDDGRTECLQPLSIRMPSSPSLLEQMHRSLCRHAKHLPPSPEFNQPGAEETFRLSKMFQSLSDQAASTTVHESLRTRKDLTLATYLSLYLLRPLNELIAYMLLPQGILLHWQVQEDSETCRFELVWTRGGPNPRQVRLAVLEGFAPDFLTVQDLQTLLMSVRLGMMFISRHGRFSRVFNPCRTIVEGRSPATKVVGKVRSRSLVILECCTDPLAARAHARGRCPCGHSHQLQ